MLGKSCSLFAEIVTASLKVTFRCIGLSVVLWVKVKQVLETARCGDIKGLFGVLWDRTVTGHWHCCATALWGGLQRTING